MNTPISPISLQENSEHTLAKWQLAAVIDDWYRIWFNEQEIHETWVAMHYSSTDEIRESLARIISGRERILYVIAELVASVRSRNWDEVFRA